MILSFITLLVLGISVLNLIRMALFLIGADIYSVKHHLKRKRFKNVPTSVSVVIPAYNESKTIIDTVASVIASNYPKELLEVIVVDDGSADNTYELVSRYVIDNKLSNVRAIRKPNGGKASALNLGIQKYATGELIMCLDADAYIHKNAVKNAVLYFNDPQVVGLAANVKVERTKGIINLIQVFEYLIAYQMKKSLTQYNIEYIIGGIGSMFRRSTLEEVGYYDSDTVTEDIDLTMKILQKGNRNVRVVYASDVITYTQTATSVSDLISQRFRWKWGRYQTFYKNKNIFFTTRRYFTKGLTWYYLPYALISDIIFLFEPVILSYILFVVVLGRDLYTLLITVMIMSFYMGMNILAEETVRKRDKLELIILAPIMYFFLYILSFVEYVALLKSLVRLPRIKNSLHSEGGSWQPVKRVKFTK